MSRERRNLVILKREEYKALLNFKDINPSNVSDNPFKAVLYNGDTIINDTSVKETSDICISKCEYSRLKKIEETSKILGVGDSVFKKTHKSVTTIANNVINACDMWIKLEFYLGSLDKEDLPGINLIIDYINEVDKSVIYDVYVIIREFNDFNLGSLFYQIKYMEAMNLELNDNEKALYIISVIFDYRDDLDKYNGHKESSTPSRSGVILGVGKLLLDRM